MTNTLPRPTDKIEADPTLLCLVRKNFLAVRKLSDVSVIWPRARAAIGLRVGPEECAAASQPATAQSDPGPQPRSHPAAAGVEAHPGRTTDRSPTVSAALLATGCRAGSEHD